MFGKLFGSKAQAATVRITPAEISFIVPAKQTILQAALDQGLAYPHNCRIGSCGSCKTRLVSGQVRELTDKSYLLTEAEMADNIILACQSVPRGDIVVDVPRFSAAGPRHDVIASAATISALTRVTSDIMALELALDSAITYTAGQYAELGLPGSAETRHYSFAEAPQQAGNRQAKFFIRHVPGGAFTDWLFSAAKAGDKLTLRAPFGDFWLRPGTAPLIAVAGGSGLGPVKAMLDQARTDKLLRDVILLFGVRTEADLYALNELTNMARNWPARLEFIPVLSAEPAGSNWTGKRGFIHDVLAEIPRDKLARHHGYLCGPPIMIDRAVQVMREAGISEDHIFYDAFTDKSSLAAAAQ